VNSVSNVVVLFNTLATRILLKPLGGADGRLVATGVEVLHRPHGYLSDHSATPPTTDSRARSTSSNTSTIPGLVASFHADREVILCGGAINTPQLLMLSGIGPRQHLTDIGVPVVLDRPGVGSDLMDHREVNVVHEVDASKMVWPAQAAGIIDSIDAYLRNPERAVGTTSGSHGILADDATHINTCTLERKVETLQEIKQFMSKFADRTEQREGAGEIVLDWYSGIPTEIGHDLHITSGEGFFFDFDLDSSEPLPDGRLRSDYLRSQTDLWHPDFLRVFHHSLIEVLKFGRTDGSIRLASADPTVPPVIDLALYKDDEALERTARGILMTRAIVRHPRIMPYMKLDADGYPVELFPGPAVDTVARIKEYLARWSAFGHHISGTAKMGRADNPRAVLNSRLQVLGVPNLRVVDTSVYPTPWLHGYNTSRGAYLVGEMGAMFIKESASAAESWCATATCTPIR
jgi:choline dehydrogenase-like flavoprotein